MTTRTLAKVKNTGKLVQMIGRDPRSGIMFLVTGDNARVDGNSELYIKFGGDGRCERRGFVKNFNPKFNEPFEGYAGLEFRTRGMRFVYLFAKNTGESVWLCDGQLIDTQSQTGKWDFRLHDDGDIMLSPAL